jgi:hypothetical protein
MRVGFIAAAVLLLVPSVAASQSEEPERSEKTVPKRAYETARVTGSPPVIDGLLDDAVWETVEWTGEFIQREPTDGIEPSTQSRFKVLYDDDALYFAYHLYDDPAKVTRQLARRDGFPGDWIEVNIDSFHDLRTAFSFTLSLSGTRGDEFISNDGNNWDSSWDPVWTGAAEVASDGWTAEARIPLSQLRFSAAEEQVWGIQVTRRLYRLEERSQWQHIPKDTSGFVSNFGELRGLRNLEPKRTIELLPYGVVSTESFEAEEGNPFRTGRSDDFDLGVDGKIGLTNNLTLDFTINPDFGQVEADPSQVNLTAFETFFSERRPFFVEGQNIFDLRLAPAITGGGFTRDQLFYSRRIGRQPGHSPDLPDGAFADSPENTTILGALKLSGKTASGLSIGLLDSFTQREEATIDLDGERSKLTVEPQTNYFVGRLQRDYRDGEVLIGGMFTAVNRNLEEHLSAMRTSAYSGGLDFSTYFGDRDYRLETAVFASEISGSAEAILDAQQASARYYQRPDNDAATLDPTRTSLSGHAGSVRFTRSNNFDLRFQTGVAWRSPGFEINDLGFMRSANEVNQFSWVGWRRQDPFSIFDRLQINGNQWLDWDYAGNFLGARFNVNSNAQFRNKYSAGVSLTREGERISNTELRGGPSSKWPGQWESNFWVNTDRRRKVSGNLGAWVAEGDDGSLDAHEYWAGIVYRPTDALRLSLSGVRNRNEPAAQYVDTVDFDSADRFVFGRLEQETTALTLRIDYSITPNLTVQFYGQPFISEGRYDEHKRITDPRAAAYRDRFEPFSADQIDFDGESYHVDENLDGVFDYSFDNPDFDFRDFNSNLVLRWEYSPGSAFFLVWNQMRSTSTLLDDQSFSDGLSELFAAPADDVILVKFSRWLSR